MKINSHKELIVWQKSMALAKEIYHATNGFPKSEIFGLTSQMRRAAIAVPSNIAEGFWRKNIKEYRRFLRIAFASLEELETQLILSDEFGYTNEADTKRISSLLEEIEKMLNKIISNLSRQILK